MSSSKSGEISYEMKIMEKDRQIIHSQTKLLEKVDNFSANSEEYATSLWQYCLSNTNEINLVENIYTIVLAFFYLCSFYDAFTQLLDLPVTKLYETKAISNYGARWIAKMMFLGFLFIQAENECYDGWKMLKYGQGNRKIVVFFGIVQFIFGCLVEILSYSLINRTTSIFDIMSNTASMTIFLIVDDIVVVYINKAHPGRRKKIAYDKMGLEKDEKKELTYCFVVKITYFILAEMFQDWFNIQIFL